jgi:hypothetical protein
MNTMTTRYRLTYRGHRGGMFYCVDKIYVVEKVRTPF